MTNHKNFSLMFYKLTTNHPPIGELHLALGNVTINIRSNSQVLLNKLQTHFQEFLGRDLHPNLTIFALEGNLPVLPFRFIQKQPDPGKSKIKEEYVDFDGGRIVRKRLTGMVLMFKESRHLAFGPCLDNLNQVINFINNRFIEYMLQQGCLLAHAAGVFFKGRGLALAGFSGSGKSTLALQLLQSGVTFVSNDRLIIQNQPDRLKIYGIPKHPRVNPGTILAMNSLHCVMSEKAREAASKLETEELWNLESKHDVIVHEHFGPNKFKLLAPLDGLLILNWQRKPQAGPLRISEISIADRPDLLDAFMKSPGLFFLPAPDAPKPDFSPEKYIHTLTNCPIFEATGYVDFSTALSFCHRFLNLDTEDASKPEMIKRQTG